MTQQMRLQKLVNLHRLRETYILKDNIGMEFTNMHFNKPAHKIDHVLNSALKEEIANVIDGTGTTVKPTAELENIIEDTLHSQQKTLVKEPDRYVKKAIENNVDQYTDICLLYTSPSPRDRTRSRMPSSA